LAALAVAEDAKEPQEPKEVTAIREMVPQLCKDLEALRGLKFDKEVLVEYQSDEDFRKYMQEKIDASYPKEKADADVALLSAVGLLEQGYDIRKEMISAMSSQALAYYEPAKGTFFVLKTQMPLEMLAPTVLHELQHALQDQKYDLAKSMEKFDDPNFDREDMSLGYRFLMEGEATYLMTKYALDKQGQGAMLGQALMMQANMGRQQMSQMERMQAQMMGEKGKSMIAALDARDKLPNYIYHMMLDPYMKGALFVHKLIEKGGFAEVDSAFKNLPTTSEQVLHPEKCIDRDEPVLLELPDLSAQLGEGAKLLAKNTLGELNMRVVFTELGVGAQEKACAGWDGDRIHAYSLPGKEWAAFVWMTTWDSEEDAAEFAKALETHKGKGKAAPLAGASVFAKGQDVLIVGGVEGDAVEAVRAAAIEGCTRK
jgi:Zn-dependent peptidase ImmA (M78 family)